ncbi:MAG: DNA repair protein RadC [Bacteroidetes bacterium]|nr:DNA repair protein RadC [Bacteroidota bacterium]MBL0066605.1 DNA repair protein RadC [Bacteroidota bacterium]MBL0138741.1 DNA repair protein RadC [Bacteroidota bacterium]
MENRLSIKSWAEEDRPREKLLLKGKHSLSDAELLAILLGSGNLEETAVELSRKILSHAGNSLYSLGRMNASELMKFKGIGEAKAITIIAALELARRRKETTETELEKISSSADVAGIFQNILGDLIHEEFWVIYLNRSNKILAKQQLSSGGMSGTVVDPRMIFKAALDHKAQAIILCHNHPSGTAKPSEADIRLTKNIVEAGKVLEISVLDHVIITQKGFYSFADEGMI